MKIHYRFLQHRASALQRGIPFELTFDQWLSIWLASGRLADRGCKRGQFVMARIGDHGAYSVGNVEIIRQEENHKQARPFQRGARGVKNPSAILTEKQVRDIRASSDTALVLSARYGTSIRNVNQIRQRLRWRHI